MRLMIATLILNEMEWLDKLYEQHKDWPDLCKWVFIESADIAYAASNPSLVSSSGLSVDGTSERLAELASKDSNIEYIPYGFSKNNDIAQGKCESRNKYLEIADKIEPDYLCILDGDEFWTHGAQLNFNKWVGLSKTKLAYSFQHREIWYPPYLRERKHNIFDFEVVGGFWDILYCRGWRWVKGMRYKDNHNTPTTPDGVSMDKFLKHHNKKAIWISNNTNYLNAPQFVHMGFASNLTMRSAKNRYYEDRGESKDRKRMWYTESRKAWESWTPSVYLPKNAKIRKYDGDIPEVFRD